MKNIVIVAAVLLLPLFAFLFLDSKKSNTMISEAIAGDRPMIMIFSSPMCGECVKMKKIIDEVEPKYAADIEFVKINAQSGDAQVQSMVKKYQIHLVPTMIFLDKSGNITKQQEGYMDKSTFEKTLKDTING